MSQMITAAAAFLIDALLGDPRSNFHPVVLIGKLISSLEKIFRRELDSPSQKIFKGGILVATVVAVTEHRIHRVNRPISHCQR